MKFHHIPFFLLFFAVLSNWVSKFPGFEFVNWLPEAFALCAVLSIRGSIRVRVYFVAIGGFLIWHGLSQYFSGVGFGTAALIRVFFMTGVMWYFFSRSNIVHLERVLAKQISLIYVLHVIFITVEAGLIETGNAGILSLLSNGVYKAAMGDYWAPVPGSLFNQSQAAAQLSIISIIWFLSLYLGRSHILLRPNFFEICVSLLAVLILYIYPNTTSFIMGIILLYILVFVIPHCKNWFFRFLMVFFLFSISHSIFNYLYYKFDVDEYGRATEYIEAFSNPIDIVEKISFDQILFGLGGLKSLAELDALDFGLGVIALQSGLVVFGFLSGVLGLIFIKTLKASYASAKSRSMQGWIWLGAVNALIVFGHVFSLVHYTVALQTGGAHLLSFHLAICLVALGKVKSWSKPSNIPKNSLPGVA